MSIKGIFERFEHHAIFVDAWELSSGHINDTYFIKTEKPPNYILQRINGSVFKDITGLMNNKMFITEHLRARYNRTKEYQTVTFIKTRDQKNYYKDHKQGCWCLMLFVEGSRSVEIVTNRHLAKEAGKLYGSFLNHTCPIDTSRIAITIPNFHHMEFRFLEFDASLKNATEERISLGNKEITTVKQLKEGMLTLHRLTVANKIPIRVTHNDTKISNALFDVNDKAICVIDLDTVMPGIIHYDFGDAIRTICANASEDEKDLSKVTFDLDYYYAFTQGFLSSVEHISQVEADYLAFSSKVMTFIMALRMLTDFLNNDIYYKTSYATYNLDRARNQLKLLKEIDTHFDRMKEIVQECYLGDF